MRRGILRIIGTGVRIYRVLTILSLMVFLAVGAFLVHHFWFSISSTNGLRFPEKPQRIMLKEQEMLVVTRGLFQEKHVYGLGAGEYSEVLRNSDGSFYLAPKLGFYKTWRPKDGYAVGGVYVPSKPSEICYVWEWPLRNENRSFANPSVNRTLSLEHDQPERELLLDPAWYGGKGFEILGRPLIDTDFQINRAKFAGITNPHQD